MNNPFAALAAPLVCRPGDYIPEPVIARPRPSRAGIPPNTYPSRENPWGLTGAQCIVMDMVIEGRKAREIGALMGLSFKTVEMHTQRARDRMQADNLVRAAILWDRFVRKESAPTVEMRMPETAA